MRSTVDPTPPWTACRVPHPDAPGLGALVADPVTFVAEDLFRRAVLTSCRAGAAPIATVERLWDDALDRHVRTPFFRLVRDGATLPAAAVCRPAGVGHRTIDDVIEPNRVVEHYRAGATMVLQGLQLCDPPLGQFANNLALALDHPVQVNAYLSPRAAKGLELHFDYHDVFVVQLAGTKRWRVWEPLARTRDPVRTAPSRGPMPTLDELGRPTIERTLRAGDCLYLPRGFPHAAETVEDESAHLTVGVMAVTWHRAVRAAVDAALDAGALRASLPAGVLADGDAGRPDGADLAPVAARVEPGALRPWLAAEIWRRQPATRRRPLDPPPVTVDGPVDVTPGPLLWLAPAPGGRSRLGLGDRQLDLPGEAHPFLAALLGAPAGFVAAEWAGELDSGSRQVVLDRLAAEGVVVPG